MEDIRGKENNEPQLEGVEHFDLTESKFDDNMSTEIGHLQLQSNMMSDENLLASPMINIQENDSGI